MPAQKKFYVVWKGRRTGIFDSWDECSAQVSGFVDAQYKAFPSRAAAEAAWKGAYEDYQGKRVSSLTPAQRALIGAPLSDSYCVDAACSGSPGPVEYRCVHTATRRQIFRQGPFAGGTNNVGEFLALVHALSLFAQNGVSQPIYSDSANAIAWVKAGKCRTKLLRTEENRQLFELIARAEQWLAQNQPKNQILKWDTAAWGENPADFGRK